MKIEFNLPFPDAILSPNSRAHWAKKIKAKNDQFDAGHYTALTWRKHFAKNAGKIAIKLTFYPPTSSHYDLDNLLARSKSTLDGVASGLGVNDKQFRPITIDMGDPDKKNPRIIVEAEIA